MLNRIIRRTEQGLELEADIRHAELPAQQVGNRKVTTPGSDADREGDKEVVPIVDAGEVTDFRSRPRGRTTWAKIDQSFSMRPRRCAGTCPHQPRAAKEELNERRGVWLPGLDWFGDMIFSLSPHG